MPKFRRCINGCSIFTADSEGFCEPCKFQAHTRERLSQEQYQREQQQAKLARIDAGRAARAATGRPATATETSTQIQQRAIEALPWKTLQHGKQELLCVAMLRITIRAPQTGDSGWKWEITNTLSIQQIRIGRKTATEYNAKLLALKAAKQLIGLKPYARFCSIVRKVD